MFVQLTTRLLGTAASPLLNARRAVLGHSAGRFRFRSEQSICPLAFAAAPTWRCGTRNVCGSSLPGVRELNTHGLSPLPLPDLVLLSSQRPVAQGMSCFGSRRMHAIDTPSFSAPTVPTFDHRRASRPARQSLSGARISSRRLSPLSLCRTARVLSGGCARYVARRLSSHVSY